MGKEKKTLIPNIDGKGHDLVEIRDYDEKSGRLDEYITVEGSASHAHIWSDPDRNQAGSKIKTYSVKEDE